MSHPQLQALFTAPPLLREHRLYQADWLLRFYGFSAGELLDERAPNLSLDFDPKTDWALRHLDQFPVEINRASYETLLRVPGIGILSAQRIQAARRTAPVDFELMRKLGVVLKRARHFITCRGKFQGDSSQDVASLRLMLLADGEQEKRYGRRQLSIEQWLQVQSAEVS